LRAKITLWQVDYARFHQTVPVSEGVVSRDSAKKQAASLNDDDDDEDKTSTTTDDEGEHHLYHRPSTCSGQDTCSAADKSPQHQKKSSRSKSHRPL